MPRGGSAQTIIDVHYGQAGGAAIQHREQSGQTSKAGSISDAGRNGDDTAIDESSDDAWQRSLHSRNYNYNIGIFQIVCMLEQAMDARDTNVVKRARGVAQKAQHLGSFFRNRKVGSACGYDERLAHLDVRKATNRNQSRHRMMNCFRQDRLNGAEMRIVNSTGQRFTSALDH